MSIQLGDCTITFGDGSIQKYSVNNNFRTSTTISNYDTNLTNSVGRPMYVCIQFASGNANSVEYECKAYVNGVVVVAATCVNYSGMWETYNNIEFIVPNNAIYKVTTVGIWVIHQYACY